MRECLSGALCYWLSRDLNASPKVREVHVVPKNPTSGRVYMRQKLGPSLMREDRSAFYADGDSELGSRFALQERC